MGFLPFILIVGGTISTCHCYLRARKPACSGPKGQAKLEGGEAQLIEYLWVHHGYQRAERIKEVIWTETPSESVVKKYINKLRHNLYECFQTDTDNLIGNMPRVGYRWQSNIQYRIIKPMTFTWTDCCRNQVMGSD